MWFYCPHGVELADRPPCTICTRKAEFHYCSHGVDNWQTTSENEPRCAYCRGITRTIRNSAIPGFHAGPRVTVPRPVVATG